MHSAKQSGNESDAFRPAAPTFERALKQFDRVKAHEKEMLRIARPIEYSAY